jgi:hypothetical protein
VGVFARPLTPDTAAERYAATIAGQEKRVMLDLAEGIRKIGFRRWYERQLIESHVYFVTAFLSLIVVVAALEEFGAAAHASTRILMLALVVAGGVLCVWSFVRYQFMLARAVRAAERSTCSQCASYGLLDVVQRSESAAAPWLRVRCRKCGHEWKIE